MKLKATTYGPDEPIRIEGEYSDQVRVELVASAKRGEEAPAPIPLRIDQIQSDHIIAWTPLHADYTHGRLELVVTDGKTEEREPLDLTEYVAPEPVEAEASSYLALVEGKDSYRIDWKPRTGSLGVVLTLRNDAGEEKTLQMTPDGAVGRGSLGKEILSGVEQRLTLETKNGLRVKDRSTKLDDVALTGNGWRVVGVKEL